MRHRRHIKRPSLPENAIEAKTYAGTAIRPQVGDIVQYLPGGASSGWEPNPVTDIALHTTEDPDFDMDAACTSTDRFPPTWPEVRVNGSWVALSFCKLIARAQVSKPVTQVRTRIRPIACPVE